MIGNQDLILGAIIVIALFGAKKLPELAAALGKSMKEFKKGVTEGATDITPGASRSCASCQTPLEAEWGHCPRCGAPAPPGITATSRT